MPRNKEAIIRYRAINRCLINKKVVPKDVLIQACEEALEVSPISERTIDQDIHDMRYDNRLGYYAPIKYDHSKGGYYYDDPNYSIDNIPLNKEEMNALQFAANTLKQFRHVHIFQTFEGAIQKIAEVLRIRNNEGKEKFDFIDLEKAPSIKGTEHLSPIIKAIQNEKTIKITYQRFGQKKPQNHLIHPYLLKEYDHRWYVIGLHDEINEIRTFGLDRIQELEESRKPYFSRKFSAQKYFDQTIGVFAPTGKAPIIKLKISNPEANYFLTKPIHHSQEVIKEEEDHIIITLKVHPTYEFRSLILSWTEAIEVLEPKELREEIIEVLKKGVKRYNN